MSRPYYHGAVAVAHGRAVQASAKRVLALGKHRPRGTKALVITSVQSPFPRGGTMRTDRGAVVLFGCVVLSLPGCYGILGGEKGRTAAPESAAR